MTGITARAFRTSAVAAANKKPSIGDAVTILQSKVSGINQVVSISTETLFFVFSCSQNSNFRQVMAKIS